MTSEEYRALLKRNNLRQADAAWMCGVGLRQARAWADDGPRSYDVPHYAEIILTAFDQGLITVAWLAKMIRSPVP
jgi:hypothetical protein